MSDELICHCHGGINWSWWETLSDELRKQFRMTPAYTLLYNYIQSGGQEDSLYCSTFKYIVRRWTHQPVDDDDYSYANMIWNLDQVLVKDGDDHQDPVQLARDLIQRDVLNDHTFVTQSACILDWDDINFPSLLEW